MAATTTTLEQLVAHLRASEKLHSEVFMKMAEADAGKFFPVDLLANAVLHRSINLVQGFATLVEQRNFICAASLLRLQLDNCLRFYAVFLVDDPHGFAMEVFKGNQVRKLKDRKGERMTDAYLVEQLAQIYPWIARVYGQTSGYIHLSNAHIFNTFAARTPGEAELEVHHLVVGAGDCFEGDELYKEATAAMIEATQVLFKYLSGWVKTKETPPDQLARKRKGRL